MIFSIIVGTILWGIIINFLNKYVSIFGTPMAWITSWFVVVCLVFEMFN